jgi:hypothetical protein
MTGFIGTSLQLQSIITVHNQWLSKTRSIPYWTTSVFRCDWLCSDLRIDHFLNFRCPLVNTPQPNTQLSYEWRMQNDGSLSQMNWTNFFITSERTEHKSQCLRVFLLFCFSVFIRNHGNVLTEPLPSNGLFRVYLLQGNVLTEPLPSNGHIRHNIYI